MGFRGIVLYCRLKYGIIGLVNPTEPDTHKHARSVTKIHYKHQRRGHKYKSIFKLESCTFDILFCLEVEEGVDYLVTKLFVGQ